MLFGQHKQISLAILKQPAPKTGQQPTSDLIVRFLKAIVQAENLNIDHKDQAMEIVAKNLNYTNSYIASVWSDYQYTVTLDQSFIALMQDEARWLMSNNLNATEIPNFNDYIYSDGLISGKTCCSKHHRLRNKK